jgi:hypothetical protein
MLQEWSSEESAGSGVADRLKNSWDAALDGGEWSASRPGRALPPVKGPPVPIVQEAGGPQIRFGHSG